MKHSARLYRHFSGALPLKDYSGSAGDNGSSAVTFKGILTIIFTVFTILFSLAIPLQASAQGWYNPGWIYRKAIIVNSGQVPSAQTNFPVLVNLSADAGLSAHARADGFDLLFTTNVWTNSFSGVYHLDEPGAGTAGEYKDATSVANNGTVHDLNVLQSSFSHIPTGGNDYRYQELTTPVDYTIVAGDVLVYDAYWTSATDLIGIGNGAVTAGTSISTPNAIQNHPTIGNGLDASNNPFRYFNGAVDEVRISTTDRSADWISTGYNNQSSPSTFYTLAGEESYTISTGTISGSPFCAGVTVAAPFTISTTFNAGNIFTAQLSNGDGTWPATPVIIGMLTSGSADTIRGTIPANTATGTGYRIRVVSSNPAVTGTDNLTINAITIIPNPTVNISGTSGICVNGTTALSPTSGGSWESNNPSVAAVTNEGVVTGLSAGSATFTFTQTSTGCSNSTSAVTVNSLPEITTQPTNELDCEGHIVSFNVVATGSGLSYTWQRKKPFGSFADIPGETNVFYPSPGTIRLQNIGNSDAPDGTQYLVVITNSDSCSITSDPATLSVNEITGITPGVTKDTICQGSNYSYLVSTSKPLNVVSYQWKKYDLPGLWLPVIDGGPISGATTNHLVFTGATPSESGQYKVTVVFHSSGADCNVTSDSRNRTLTVNPTPSCLISGDASVFTGSANNLYTSTPNQSDNVTHSWIISGNGTINGLSTGSSVLINASVAGTILLKDRTTRLGCVSSCTYPINVIDLPCSISPIGSVFNGSLTTYNAPDGMDSYDWSVSGNGSIPSGIRNRQTVTILAGNNCNTYTLTLTIVKKGATSYCSQTIPVSDNISPSFILPTAFTECVKSLNTAIYNGATMDINPLRPDSFTFVKNSTVLDLDTLAFTDNCLLSCPVEIRWKINMANGTTIPASSSYLTGQPSTYGSNITFLGDGVTFNNVDHSITYWIVDCAGNVSAPQIRTITIKPRPNIIKQN